LLFNGDCNGLVLERAVMQNAKVIVIQIPAQPEPLFPRNLSRYSCLGTNSKSLQFHSGSDNIRDDLLVELALRLAP
jgi:hypothetical protein